MRTPTYIATCLRHRLARPEAGPAYVDALVTRATARDANRRQPDAKVLLAQVRRARIALQQGLADDPELTRELRAEPRQGTGSEAARPRHYEVTQMVPTPVPAASASPDGHAVL